jgi:transcriptional regulator with XRE-family HTH domain
MEPTTHSSVQCVDFMAFPDRLAGLRKDKAFTQKELAEMVGLNQAQIHRYEKGAAEPSMSALKRLALALGVTTDELVFEDDERGPDDDLRLQFEAVSRFSPDEKRTAKEVLDSLILKHEAKRWASSG